jgi:coproporphyrinogen III oxidase-like Fe-S oxidoreductase
LDKIIAKKWIIMEKKLLYIHIPFCDSKCNYCAFNSYTNINHLKKNYFKALKKQYLFDVDSEMEFETVFIFGYKGKVFKDKNFFVGNEYLKEWIKKVVLSKCQV